MNTYGQALSLSNLVLQVVFLGLILKVTQCLVIEQRVTRIELDQPLFLVSSQGIRHAFFSWEGEALLLLPHLCSLLVSPHWSL